MNKEQYELWKDKIKSCDGVHSVLTAHQRASLRWSLFDFELQNYIQSMWTPSTTETSLTELAVNLEKMNDLELVDAYVELLKGVSYGDRSGVYAYFDEFPSEINDYLKFVYSGSEQKIANMLNFESPESMIESIKKDGYIGRFG